MASVSRSLSRTALSFTRQVSSRSKPSPSPFTAVSPSFRPFSVSHFRRQDDDKPSSDVKPTENSEVAFSELPQVDEFFHEVFEELERDREVRDLETERARKPGFWGESEKDNDVAYRAEDGDEDNNDAITTMAHSELEQHRDIREYSRIAVWDMPSLSNLAKPFSLPPQTHLLRFRYTTYMGETHPAEAKVVVELCSKDLAPTYLSEEQRKTFLKLVGPRYNPDTDIIHMSCEKYSTRAQNKRYLGDLVDTLIKEAKEGDAFNDVPLDLRHHKSKPRYSFPNEWRMTEERRKQLEAERQQRELAIHERGLSIDGNNVIADAIARIPALSQVALPGAPQQKSKQAVPVAAAKGRKPAPQRRMR